MNDSDQDIEHTLRAMQWRHPPPEFLQRSLDAALAERQAAETFRLCAVPRPKQMTTFFTTLLRGIPRPVRWPLAACWVLSMFFRLTTPDPVPASTRAAIARMPPIDPVLMVAEIEQQQRLTAELLDGLLHQRFDSRVTGRSANSPLP